MKTKVTVCAVSCIACGWMALAESYYFKADATDFSVEKNYTVGSATGDDSTVIPGPNDIVIMPKATKAYSLTAGTKNFTDFAQIGEFRVDNFAGITFILTVPSGTATISTKFNSLNGSRSRDTARWFTIEKLGGGELVLSGLDKYPASHAQNAHWNYMVALRVKEGALAFDTADFNATEIVTGIIDVSAGATVKVPYHASKDLSWTCGGLSGAGLITNECEVADRKTSFSTFIGAYSQDFKFSGAIGGAIAPTFTSENDLRDSRSTFSFNAGISANDSGWTDAAGMMNGSKLRRITAVDILGNVGKSSPLGMGNIAFSAFGGEIYYDGEGEETDKCVTFAHTTESGKLPCCFNAGSMGGLVWEQNGSEVFWQQATSGRDTRVILRGENMNPCVVNCPIKCNSNGWSPNFMKRGMGKWVFANADNDFSGAVFVEEGVLGFRTLAESGSNSSLGTSGRLHKWYDGGVSKEDWNQLDGQFAFTLGCPTNAEIVGALEYLGSDRVKCITRAFGLNGTGGVINDGAGELTLGNATVATEGKKTSLYLGGSNVVASTFYDVTNGVGKIAVVKDGSGTWKLGNNIDIDAVEVKGGTLVLEKTTGLPYTWFRFIQKEALNIDYATTPGTPTSVGPFFPAQQEFILYDEDGNRQLINPDYRDKAVSNKIASPRDYHLIGPNSLAYGKSGSLNWGGSTGVDRGATNLFDNASSGAGMLLTSWNGSGSVKPTVDNPGSWISLVMRMPEDAPKITSCDLVIDNNGSYGAELGAWALEGSRDGEAWEPITNVCWNSSLSEYTNHRRDYKGKSGAKGCYCYAIDQGLGVEDYGWVPGDKTPRPGMGYSFAGVVTNQFAFPTRLSSVKLSGGGVLKIAADISPTVDTLTVDATTGGSVLNVAYAETGTLNLVNVGNEASITVPGSLAGLDLEGWTINLPQGAKNRIVAMRGDQLTITKRGLVLIVR